MIRTAAEDLVDLRRLVIGEPERPMEFGFRGSANHDGNLSNFTRSWGNLAARASSAR